MDFFDEDDVLNDNDEFKPGLLDEDDDEFFTTDDTFVDHYEEYEKRNLNNNPQVIKIEINSPKAPLKNTNDPKMNTEVFTTGTNKVPQITPTYSFFFLIAL